MLYLLACVTELPSDKPNEDPFSDTDEADTADSAVDTDTGSENGRCNAPGEELPLEVGGVWASPHATLVVADLDGGGVADVLHESWSPRSVALVRGEDVVFGVTTPTMSFPATMPTEQAAFTVGVTGDLDGDGLDEVILGERAEWGDSAFVAWSSAAPDAPVLVVPVGELDGTPFPARTPGPDLDGDGRGEIVVMLGSTYTPQLLVFPGGTTGNRSVDDASLVVNANTGAGYGPVSAGDLDGDGIGDVLYVGRSGPADRILFLPGELAGMGGVLDEQDLDVTVAPQMYTHPPLLLDLDGDELPELYTHDRAGGGNRVEGFAGTDVAAAVASGVPLTPDDTFVRIDGIGDDYLGAHLVPVTDLDCETGIAASAHFNQRVYLFSNADLVAGGVLQAAESLVLGGTGHWFGYALGGGHDLDLDGSLDLVVGDTDGGTFGLYLSPAKLAVAP